MSETEDAALRDIFRRVHTIAVVGASAKPERPSHAVAAFLAAQGYRVVPVNPGIAGQSLHGETVRASLRDIGEDVDMVDIFRASDQVPPVVDEAMMIGAKVIWMQLGIRHEDAAARARAAGLAVVMDRCPKIEIPRLGLLRTAGR